MLLEPVEIEESLFSEPISSPLVVNNEVGSDRSEYGRAFDDQSAVGRTTQIVNRDDLVTSGSTTSDKTPVPVFSYQSFIGRTWTLVVLGVALVGTCASLWMLTYVLLKMCDGTLTGNQTMGLLLLFGVTCLFASVIPWLLPPNEMICATRHFLHPLVMVLCFAILLVKSMQLRSLISVGLGGTIPQINQVVSLIFMVLVQVVIAGEWYITSSPLGISMIDGYPMCGVSKNRFLLLHLYPVTLLLLGFFYSISVFKIKRNFNEGQWITGATTVIVPVFAAWCLVCYFAPIQYHDPAAAVSIVAVAGILLTAIFIPKLHTIAQQSKAKSIDLNHSHSDSTVFTGFSDYGVPPFPPGKNHQKYYPVYGYTPQYLPPVPPPPMVPPPPPPRPGFHHPPKPVRILSPSRLNQGLIPFTAHSKMPPPPTRISDFNGLNYVSGHNRRGPRLTSYQEWTREMETNAHTHHQQKHRGQTRRRHSSSPQRPREEDGHFSRKHRFRRSKSSSREHLLPSGRTRGRSRSRRPKPSGNNKPEPSPQHYLRIHTNSNNPNNAAPVPVPEVGVGGATSSTLLSSSLNRRQFSQSPSDGMILTAAGLRDTFSAEKQELGLPMPASTKSSNVVIVDGNNPFNEGNNNNSSPTNKSLDLRANGVYLATS